MAFTNITPEMERICEMLWGPDWMAPLAETLRVNRRTVERWRSGKVRMPDSVEQVLRSSIPLTLATRTAGQILRRIGNGESVEDIQIELETLIETLRDENNHLANVATGRIKYWESQP